MRFACLSPVNSGAKVGRPIDCRGDLDFLSSRSSLVRGSEEDIKAYRRGQPSGLIR